MRFQPVEHVLPSCRQCPKPGAKFSVITPNLPWVIMGLQMFMSLWCSQACIWGSDVRAFRSCMSFRCRSPCLSSFCLFLHVVPRGLPHACFFQALFQALYISWASIRCPFPPPRRPLGRPDAIPVSTTGLWRGDGQGSQLKHASSSHKGGRVVFSPSFSP